MKVTNILKNSTKFYHIYGYGNLNSSNLKASNHSIITDIPKVVGGKDNGPQPVEMLLSGLIGCETATCNYIARNMKPRIKIDKIDFNIKAERNEDGALLLPIGRTDLPSSSLNHIYGTAYVYTKSSQVIKKKNIKLII
jgi:hypothetical protein